MSVISEVPAKVTAIIRSVNKISTAAEITISLLSHYVDQILILFSGPETECSSISKRYESDNVISVIRVYSFGYVEPILVEIKDKIRNHWMMFLTDRDIPSIDFLKSLGTLILRDVSGFMIKRIIDDNTPKRNIPLWLKEYLKPGFRSVFIPLLYRTDKIVISEVIHTSHKILGKIEYLNPDLHYVSRSYTTGDMETDEVFMNHWIEKEARYIFIEMFETRKSRIAAFAKIVENIPLLKNVKFKHEYHKFLFSELSNFEYIIFELIRSFSMGSIRLTPYQKVKIRTIKNTRKFNSIGFFISEFLRTKNENLIGFLNMHSAEIGPDRNDFNDLAIVEGSEYAFIKRLLDRFMETNGGWNNTEVEMVITQVKHYLKINVDKYMPQS